MEFFLLPANVEIWSKVQGLASANNDESNKAIRQHVLEAQRLTSAQRNLRIVIEDITVDGQAFKKGDQVVCLLVSYWGSGLSSCFRRL